MSSTAEWIAGRIAEIPLISNIQHADGIVTGVFSATLAEDGDIAAQLYEITAYSNMLLTLVPNDWTLRNVGDADVDGKIAFKITKGVTL